MTGQQLVAAVADPEYQPYQPVPVMSSPSPQQILYIQENASLFPAGFIQLTA
jgi:hypothetical protein